MPYIFTTITTGKTEKVPVDLTPDEMLLLKPLVLAGGGVIPAQPQYQCVITSLDGGALFTVERDEQQLAYCGVACTATAAEEVWARLQEAHLASYEKMVSVLGFDTPDNWLTIPKKPAELPWVGVSQQPGLVYFKGVTEWLGGFEVALGQALLLEAMGKRRS